MRSRQAFDDPDILATCLFVRTQCPLSNCIWPIDILAEGQVSREVCYIEHDRHVLSALAGNANILGVTNLYPCYSLVK